MRRIHVWITGIVQGISYRSFIKEQAFDLDLTGWVRNLPDGRVEAVFEGEPKPVEKMIALCRKGPSGSSVTDITEKEEEPQHTQGFEIVY